MSAVRTCVLLLTLLHAIPVRGGDEDMAARAIEEFAKKHEGCRVTRDAARPGKPVVEVVLHNSTVSDEQLKHVGALRTVRRLSVSDCGVTDDGLRHLAGLTELKSLCLSAIRVTDDGLRHLAALASLDELEVSHSRDVTDAGMKVLARLKTLQSLSVASTVVGDDGAAELGVMKSLRVLSLGGTRIGDAGVKHLTGLAELRALDLSDTHITGDALAEVKKLGRLEVLELGATDVSDAGVKHLRGMEHVVRLNLLVLNAKPGLTDACLDDLLTLKGLKSLDLASSGMTAWGLTKLAKLPALEELYLVAHTLDPVIGAFCVGQTDRDLRGLAKLIPWCRVSWDLLP